MWTISISQTRVRYIIVCHQITFYEKKLLRESLLTTVTEELEPWFALIANPAHEN